MNVLSEPWQKISDLKFLLFYIAARPDVTTAEALEVAATDPVLPVAVRALAAETALDAKKVPA